MITPAYCTLVLLFSVATGETVHIFYSYAHTSDGWGDGTYLALPKEFFESAHR
jgi:hypothetical protein